MRRASVAEVETHGTRQAPEFRFGRRLSLSSLGSGKYGRADDSYGDRDKVIVRHVPIVIEGVEEESEKDTEAPVIPGKDDGSSLSSLCSDNSVETNSVGYQPWDEWRRRGRKGGVLADYALNTPLKDIMQPPAVKKKSDSTRPDLTPGPQYILKTETVGMESCPVHRGEREGASGKKHKRSTTSNHAHGPLRAPSLIQGRNDRQTSVTPTTKLPVVLSGRPKHSTIPTQPARTQFERGLGQGSFRGKKEVKEAIQETRKSDPAFQRRWSFRTPSVTPNNIPSLFHDPTLASLSRSLGDNTHEYFRGINKNSKEKQESLTKKCSSNSNLNRTPSSSHTACNSRMTPSSSTSSIPSKVFQERSPYVGILKAPGKRKVSSNNRVEFLNNVMEKEIPGRHT